MKRALNDLDLTVFIFEYWKNFGTKVCNSENSSYFKTSIIFDTFDLYPCKYWFTLPSLASSKVLKFNSSIEYGVFYS